MAEEQRLERIEATQIRIEDKLDGRMDRQDERMASIEKTASGHAVEDEKRFARLEKIGIAILVVIASPKVGGPDASSLAAHVLSAIRS